MNPWSRAVLTLLWVAGLSGGQTAPANNPSPAAVAVPAQAQGTPAGVTAPTRSVYSSQPDTDNPPDTVVGPPPAAPAAGSGPAPAVPPAGSANPKKAAAPDTGAPPPAATPRAATASPKTAPADAAGRYILGPNDVVSVMVWGDKNLTNTYSIGPDGRMSMPLIGDFKAVGLTVPGLKDLITQKLTEFINEPIVNVELLRNNSKKYTLIGGVLKPGPVPLLEQTTILDALAAAGGFKDFANKKKIVLMRGTRKFPFNYNDAVKGRHMEQNITLQDGDIIYVPGGD